LEQLLSDQGPQNSNYVKSKKKARKEKSKKKRKKSMEGRKAKDSFH